jgi:hypothetical protein
MECRFFLQKIHLIAYSIRSPGSIKTDVFLSCSLGLITCRYDKPEKFHFLLQGPCQYFLSSYGFVTQAVLFLQMFPFQTKPYKYFSSPVCVPLVPPILCSVMLFFANYPQKQLVYSPADSPDNVKGSSNTDVSNELLQGSRQFYL